MLSVLAFCAVLPAKLGNGEEAAAMEPPSESVTTFMATVLVNAKPVSDTVMTTLPEAVTPVLAVTTPPAVTFTRAAPVVTSYTVSALLVKSLQQGH